MPSSRVFGLLIGSAVLLGSTAGVFAVGSIVPTAASSPQATNEDAGVVPSSPSAADTSTEAAEASDASKAPSSTVPTEPREESDSDDTGSAATDDSASGSSTSGSTAAGSAGSSAGRSTATAGPRSSSASSASSARPIGNGRTFIGTTAGGYRLASGRTGVGLANHAYAAFDNKLPQAAMTTVRVRNATWRQVATAKPGSAIDKQIAGWARAAKARSGSVMLAYSHEPEAKGHANLGSSTDYIAAWRRVTSIFDREGATNVVWAWQMTAYSFKTKSSSSQYAAKWYPGDDIIDIVAADGYDWGTCRGRKSVGMASFADPVIAFAKAHGKKVVLGEFGSTAGAHRAAWLKDAHRYLIANREMIVAAFYFNLHDAGQPCHWTLTTDSEYSALRAMATDTANFRV